MVSVEPASCATRTVAGKYNRHPVSQYWKHPILGVSLPGFHDLRTPLVQLCHLCLFVAVGHPKSALKNLCSCIVHLLPTMEPATLAHRPDRIGESMVHIMEEHLVPTMATAQDPCHYGMKLGPCAVRILGNETVPGQRMREVSDEHPSKRKAHTSPKRHCEHESPSLAEGPSQRECANQPDACPHRRYHELVVQAARKPLRPELLVALAAGTTIGEMHVPLECKEATRVVEASEMDER